MATVHPISGPSSAGGSSPRGPTYFVTTRELSADFTNVGSDEASREVGTIDGAHFLRLLEKLVALDSLKLVDADPQLFVTVKSGRFLIQPQGGKLLVRPTTALDQIFFKLSPAEIPPFLDGAPPPPPPKPPTTLIGSAAARIEAGASASAPASGSSPRPAKKSQRSLVLGLAAVGLVGIAGAAWFIFDRAPTPPPPAPKPVPVVTATPPPKPAPPPPEFDPVTSAGNMLNLQKRFAGTYATSGEAGERLLELRLDGTFRYQEFGASLAVTKHDNGPYTFELRHGTQTPVLRAPILGPIEIRDENSLFIRNAVFTRLPVAAK